jgi:uncharacterized protein (TIGR02246 family)
MWTNIIGSKFIPTRTHFSTVAVIIMMLTPVMIGGMIINHTSAEMTSPLQDDTTTTGTKQTKIGSITSINDVTSINDTAQIVNQLLKNLEQQWNIYDSNGYAKYFANNADFVDVLGRLVHGANVIERIHQKNFETIHAGSVVKLEMIDAQKLSDNIILAHVRGLLHVPAGPLEGENRSTQTLILQNIDGLWKIRAFHNTFVKDMPGVPKID